MASLLKMIQEKALYIMEFILEKIISLLSGITIEKAQVYFNALKSSNVSWYCDTFGMMHRYSCTLYCPIYMVYVTLHRKVTY